MALTAVPALHSDRDLLPMSRNQTAVLAVIAFLALLALGFIWPRHEQTVVQESVDRRVTIINPACCAAPHALPKRKAVHAPALPSCPTTPVAPPLAMLNGPARQDLDFLAVPFPDTDDMRGDGPGDAEIQYLPAYSVPGAPAGILPDRPKDRPKDPPHGRPRGTVASVTTPAGWSLLLVGLTGLACRRRIHCDR
jgi:hypothetical protein